MFPLRFVDCLCSMYAVLRSFLVTVNTNLLLNEKPAPYVVKKVSNRLQACAVSKSIMVCFFYRELNLSS